MVPVCVTPADTFWKAAFFVGTISVFFGIPLILLVGLYTVIARHLMVYPCIMASHQQQSHQHHHQQLHTSGHHASGSASHQSVANSAPTTPSAIKYRKQVVMMLGTVVLSFFICLLPFRAFTLWIIIVPPEAVMSLGPVGYYNLLFFCRIMLYLNSAINPILYNLMSSKFRDGFMRLCGVRKCKKNLRRKGTFNTTTSTTTCSSSQNNRMSPEGFWRRSLTSTRGSLGGDSLRAALQRKSSTASSASDSASAYPPRVQHQGSVGGGSWIARQGSQGTRPTLTPLLNGNPIHAHREDQNPVLVPALIYAHSTSLSSVLTANTTPAHVHPAHAHSRLLMESATEAQRRLRVLQDLDESFV